MAEPGIGAGAVPVLDISGDDNDVAGFEFLDGFALLLVVALAGDTEKSLTAAFGSLMNVPVVAAARLKGDVGKTNALSGLTKRIEVALTDEILRKFVVRLAEAENVGFFK